MVKEHELFINPEEQAGISKAFKSLPHNFILKIMVAELEEDERRKGKILPQKRHHRLDRESGK